MHPRHADAGGGGQVLESAGGGVAVHPSAEDVPQDRPVGAVVYGAVDRASYRGWQRDENDFAALATHAQHPVAVFLTQMADVGSARFEDPQPEQAEQSNQGEVVPVGR
jgi:hypothetical protein